MLTKKTKRYTKSESPEVFQVAKKRFIEKEKQLEEYHTVTPSTVYQKSNIKLTSGIKVQSKQQMQIQDNRRVYLELLREIDFLDEYNKLNQILKLFFPKKTKKPKEKTFSINDLKRISALDFLNNVTNFQKIVQMIGMSRQNIKIGLLNGKIRVKFLRKKRTQMQVK